MESDLQELADKAVRFATDSGTQYCDIRAEHYERKEALIENNETEYTRTSNDSGIGVRLVKDGTWSFFSITNPDSFEQIKNSLKNICLESSDVLMVGDRIHDVESAKKAGCIPVLKINEIEKIPPFPCQKIKNLNELKKMNFS